MVHGGRVPRVAAGTRIVRIDAPVSTLNHVTATLSAPHTPTPVTTQARAEAAASAPIRTRRSPPRLSSRRYRQTFMSVEADWRAGSSASSRVACGARSRPSSCLAYLRTRAALPRSSTSGMPATGGLDRSFDAGIVPAWNSLVLGPAAHPDRPTAQKPMTSHTALARAGGPPVHQTDGASKSSPRRDEQCLRK